MTEDEAVKIVCKHARYQPNIEGGIYSLRWPKCASRCLFDKDTRQLVLKLLERENDINKK